MKVEERKIVGKRKEEEERVRKLPVKRDKKDKRLMDSRAEEIKPEEVIPLDKDFEEF